MAATPNDLPVKAARPRADGRRTLLVYLEGDQDLKKAALDEECNVYEIVEEAARHWLDRRKERPKKANANKGHNKG